MERVAGIEPASQPWKGRIKATILYPRIWLLVGWYDVLTHLARLSKGAMILPQQIGL